MDTLASKSENRDTRFVPAVPLLEELVVSDAIAVVLIAPVLSICDTRLKRESLDCRLSVLSTRDLRPYRDVDDG